MVAPSSPKCEVNGLFLVKQYRAVDPGFCGFKGTAVVAGKCQQKDILCTRTVYLDAAELPVDEEEGNMPDPLPEDAETGAVEGNFSPKL